jgi:hypothetical protein
MARYGGWNDNGEVAWPHLEFKHSGSQLPAPGLVEEQTACLVVRDHNGQAFAYVHFEH